MIDETTPAQPESATAIFYLKTEAGSGCRFKPSVRVNVVWHLMVPDA